MFKKLVCMMFLMQGCSVLAGAAVVENFDWGSGVPGREALTAGSPVRGVRVPSADEVFQDTAKDRSVFAGASGSGKGVLLMKGLNNSVGFNYPVSAVTVVKAEGKFSPGDTTRGVRGFWIGVQSKTPDNPLLNNQKTDRLSVQLGQTGNIILRSVVGGVTNTAKGDADGSIKFSPGDSVKMELTINMAEQTASVKVTGTGEGNVKIKTVKWNSAKIPDWGMVVINKTGEGELLLNSVEVRTVPIILG